MSTNFFERQASAKKSTLWLLVMFALATVAIVVTVTVVVAIAVTAANAGNLDKRRLTAANPPWALPFCVVLARCC